MITKALETPNPAVYQSPTQDIALVASGSIVIESAKTDTLSSARTASTSVGASVLDRIAACESQNDPRAKNPRSSASGRFQFLTSSWEAYGRQLWGTTEGKDIFSYEDSTELAEYVYSIEGTTPWESSRYCWGSH